MYSSNYVVNINKLDEIYEKSRSSIESLLGKGECSNVLKAIAESIVWSPQNALDLSSQEELLTTGDEGLDDLLGGGIPTQGITELVGQSSTGNKRAYGFVLCLSSKIQL